MEQIPTVGRMVHYMSRGSADGVFPPMPRAATITVKILLMKGHLGILNADFS